MSSKKITISKTTTQQTSKPKTKKSFAEFGWGAALLAIGVLLLLASAILFPLATIWSLNTLFSLTIPYTFYTWLAMTVLIFTIQGAINIKNKNK